MISKKDEKILREMLSRAVESDQALTYDEMRGFLFGLAITPDVIMPSEWLPRVFGEEMITIESEEDGNRLLNTLMRVVNDLTGRFHAEDLFFPFAENYLANEGDIGTVQEWTYGLNEALALRPECWYETLPDGIPDNEVEYEEEMMTVLSVIHGIAEPDEAEELFERQGDEEEEAEEEEPSARLLASLFVMLPASVDAILEHAFLLEEERREQMQNRPAFPPTIKRDSPKVGRNEPCPCGSGKKHKKCCLRKE